MVHLIISQRVAFSWRHGLLSISICFWCRLQIVLRMVAHKWNVNRKMSFRGGSLWLWPIRDGLEESSDTFRRFFWCDETSFAPPPGSAKAFDGTIDGGTTPIERRNRFYWHNDESNNSGSAVPFFPVPVLIFEIIVLLGGERLIVRIVMELIHFSLKFLKNKKNEPNRKVDI